jgi:uncharacterized protein YndB with AHSA1/START domain
VSVSTEASVEIGAPAGAVFRWLVERDRATEWLGAGLGWLPTDPADLRAGWTAKTRLAQRTPRGPKYVDAEIEVLGIEPPSLAHFRTIVPALVVETSYRLQPSGPGRTRLDCTVETSHRGVAAIWSGLTSRLGPDLTEIQRADQAQGLARLKELAEARSRGA